jgi:hypothetical protein
LNIPPGLAGGGPQNIFEIVNLDDSSPFLVCDNISVLPGHATSAIAFLYNKITPISCKLGGLCYSFEDGRMWKDGPKYPWQCDHSVTFSSFTERTNKKIQDIVLLHCGQYNATVFSFDGMQWRTGVYADLPVHIRDNCMVRINDSMVMVMGGYKHSVPGYMAGDSYFFNVIENKWIIGPQLIKTRGSPVCGVMTWKKNRVIVVAGGYELKSPDVPLKSVEFLFLNDFDNFNLSWVEGPSLPYFIEGTALVEFDNGVILVGGQEITKYGETQL